MTYLARRAASTVLAFAQSFPVVAITGPRPSDKTSLFQHLFPGEYTLYLTLDDVSLRAQVEQDIRGFLALGEKHRRMIVDEAQYAPALFPYLKTQVDEYRGEKGRFFLTGTHVFQLTKNLSESVAGRVGWSLWENFPPWPTALAMKTSSISSPGSTGD